MSVDLTWQVNGGRLSIRHEYEGIGLKATLTSQESRAMALEVLTEQGPYLTFQPPNESMREVSFPYGQTPWKRKPSRPTSGAVAWVRNALDSHTAADLYAALMQAMNEDR